MTADLYSVGVAVTDPGGHPVAALALTYPKSEDSASQRHRLAALLRTAADDVARRLRGPRAQAGSSAAARGTPGR